MRIEKEFRNSCLAANGEPASYRFCDRLPEGEASVFAALASYMEVQVLRFERHIIHSKPDQFGNAQSGGDAQVEHGSIADAESRGGIWVIENGFALLGGEMIDQGSVGLLVGNGMDSTDLLERARNAMLHKTHKRLDCGQPSVAGA